MGGWPANMPNCSTKFPLSDARSASCENSEVTERSKRLLVTGSTGFIGRHLLPLLLDEGFDLVLPVRDVQRCPQLFRDHPGIQIIRADQLERQEPLDEALRRTSGIIHLAGLAHVADPKDAKAFENTNARMTAHLVQCAGRADGISLFVHMSSLAAVTDNVSTSTIDDMTVPRPATDYGISKLQAEAHAATLTSRGVCAISLRPPLVVGFDAKGNWASLQKLGASGVPLPFAGIRNRRSMVSVQTVTQAITHLCRSRPPAEKSGNYCVADPETLSLREILIELRAGLGMSPRLWPFPAFAFAALGHAMRRRRLVASLIDDLVVDPSRFYSTFEFRPSIPLREAIRRSGADYGSAQSAVARSS